MSCVPATGDEEVIAVAEGVDDEEGANDEEGGDEAGVTVLTSMSTATELTAESKLKACMANSCALRSSTKSETTTASASEDL